MSLVWQLVRAELLKLRTTRTAWFLFGGFALLLLLLLAISLGNTPTKDLKGADGIRTVLPAGAQIGYLFALCLGVIGMAGEYRHETMGHALLAAPKRWQIVLAKLIAYFVAGFVLGVLAFALTFAIAAPWMSAKHAGPVSLGNVLPRKILVGTIFGCGLFGAIGVALGAVLKEQVLALFVGIGFSVIVHNLIASPAPAVAKYLPTGALNAAVRGSEKDLVDWPIGFLLLVGYVIVLGAVGAYLVRDRDLT